MLTLKEILKVAKQQEQMDNFVPALCLSCGEEVTIIGECNKSKRPCGHHCNCSWTHDECCWCGEEFGAAE